MVHRLLHLQPFIEFIKDFNHYLKMDDGVFLRTARIPYFSFFLFVCCFLQFSND